MDQQQPFITSEQVAISRLFDAVLDMPCHVDIFEHSMPGAATALEIWARAHEFAVTRHTHKAGDGHDGYTVIACDPGLHRSIRVFK